MNKFVLYVLMFMKMMLYFTLDLIQYI